MADMPSLPGSSLMGQPSLNPADQLNTNIDQAVKAAPELKQVPGTAVAVAQHGGDVGGNAQAVAMQGRATSVDKSFQNLATVHGSGVVSDVFGWFSHTASDIGHDVMHIGDEGVHAVEHVANAGLNYTQHIYRYLHDVEALHGRMAAILEIAGIAAGAIALGVATGGLGDVALGGALAAGEVGADVAAGAETADLAAGVADGASEVADATAGRIASQGAVRGAISRVAGTQARLAPYALGATAAGGIEGRLAYRDSWARTANGATYRDPHTGMPVSVGRDIASALHLKGGAYTTVSGVGDAIGDLAMDPLANAGSMVGGARSAEGLAGVIGRRVAGGTAARSAEDVSRVYQQYPAFRNAVDYMANHTSGEILARFPELAGGAGEGKPDEFLLSRLGNASSKEDVLNAFAEAVRTNELTQTGKLPTMTNTRQAALDIRDMLAEVPGVGRPIRAARRLPVVFNPDTLQFSHTEFDPSDDYGAQAIYRMVLMGEKPSVARSVASAYLNTPLVGERLAIYRNAVVDTLVAMAQREGAKLGSQVLHGQLVLSDADKAAIGQRVDELLTKARPGNGIFGMNDGRDISKVIDPETGKWHSAAITPNQTGTVSLPNFTAMKRAAAQIANHRDLFGKGDDWLYDHITRNIFKRFVLLTGGFALRVATSENIPNSLRLGVRNLLVGRADVSRLEGNVLTRWMWNIGAGQWNAERTDFAARLGLLTGGYEAYGGSAEHALEAEAYGDLETDQRSLRRGMDSAPERLKPTDEFVERGPGTPHNDRLRAWQAELAENANSVPSQTAADAYLVARAKGAEAGVAQQEAVRQVEDWLDAQPKRWLQKFEREYFTSDETGAMTPHQDWANVIVSKMMGAVTGTGGEVNEDLLDRIRRGDSFGNSLRSRSYRGPLADLTDDQIPAKVKGRVYVPDGTGGLQRLANVGFRRVLNPIINWMSRQPLFETEAYKEYRLLKPQVDAGLLNTDQAVSLAASRATNKMMRFVHNLNERTQMSETVRNWMPFYFAQEQAYKRVFRLLAEEPGAFVRYTRMLSAVHRIGAQYTDTNGQNYFVYPASGFLTSKALQGIGATGMPIVGSNLSSFTGNLSSAGVMFPFAEGVRPDVGPVIAIPTKAMQSFFAGRLPVATKIATDIEGPVASQEPLWEAMIPNSFVARAVDAYTGASEAFQSAQLQTMQALAEEGQLPAQNNPLAQQDFINRVRSQTQITFALKAMLGLVTPLSPSVKIQDWGLKSDFQAYIQGGKGLQGLDSATQAFLKKHPNGLGDVFSAEQAFLADHPDSTPYTVFQSTSSTGGFIGDTNNAINWVQANKALVKNNPYASAWLMPVQANKGAYSSTAYNEEIAMGLRTRRTPEQFLTQLYVAAGDNQYYNHDRPTYYAGLLETAGYPPDQAQQLAAKGLTPDQESKLKTMGGQAAAALYAEWSNYQQQFQVQNPVWYAQTGSNKTAARIQQTISELQQVFAKGQAPDPNSQQTQNIKALLDGYDQYHSAIVAGRSDNWARISKTNITTQWQLWLQQVQNENPSLTNIITSVFMNAPG